MDGGKSSPPLEVPELTAALTGPRQWLDARDLKLFYGGAPWLHAHSYIPYLGCTRVYSIGAYKGESFRRIKICIESIEIGKVRISLFV